MSFPIPLPFHSFNLCLHSSSVFPSVSLSDISPRFTKHHRKKSQLCGVWGERVCVGEWYLNFKIDPHAECTPRRMREKTFPVGLCHLSFTLRLSGHFPVPTLTRHRKWEYSLSLSPSLSPSVQSIAVYNHLNVIKLFKMTFFLQSKLTQTTVEEDGEGYRAEPSPSSSPFPFPHFRF